MGLLFTVACNSQRKLLVRRRVFEYDKFNSLCSSSSGWETMFCHTNVLTKDWSLPTNLTELWVTSVGWWWTKKDVT